jgi:hypothetical protein
VYKRHPPKKCNIINPWPLALSPPGSQKKIILAKDVNRSIREYFIGRKRSLIFSVELPSGFTIFSLGVSILYKDIHVMLIKE